MLYVIAWMIRVSTTEHSAAEPTDWMKPPSWSGNFWGPAATRARGTGQLPPLPVSPAMTRWRDQGRERPARGRHRLPDGRRSCPARLVSAQPVHRQGDGQRVLAHRDRGDEDGSPVVYDCSSPGVQRQPFEIWMLDCVGSMGVKRLKPEHSRHIPA